MKKYVFILFLGTLSWNAIQAQVTIGSGDTPHESAILDLKTLANDKGFLGPRVALISTDSQEPITGDMAVGLLVYNTEDSPSGIEKSKRVKANKFYYWADNQWVQFVEEKEIQQIVTDTINRLGIPRHAIFSMDGNQNITVSELGLSNFLQGRAIGTSRDIPLVETVNHTQGNISLERGSGDVSKIIMKKGTYSIMFTYGFYGNASAATTCQKSSYFMDFPISSTNNRARIHSNCPHGQKTYGQHGGSINYVVHLTDEKEWIVQLGLGQAGDQGCYSQSGSLLYARSGFDLRNNSTFLYISLISEPD